MKARLAALLVLACLALGPSTVEAQRRVTRAAGGSAERDVASSILALLVVGAGAGIGAAIGSETTTLAPCASVCFEGLERTTGALRGTALGANIGFALFPAVYTLVQSGLGGRGDAGGAYLGWLMGAAVGGSFAVVGYVLDQQTQGPYGAVLMVSGAAVGGIMGFIGTVVGYSRSEDRAVARPRVDVLTSSDGVQLLLSGSF